MNFFKKILPAIKTVKRVAKTPGSNPEKAWYWFLGTFLVALAVSGTFHYLIFMNTRSIRENIDTATTTASIGTIDRGTLDEVVSKFEERKENLKTIREDVRGIEDPSI